MVADSDPSESTPLLRPVRVQQYDQCRTSEGAPPSASGETSAASQKSYPRAMNLDLKEIDARFKRWIDHIVRKRSAYVSPLERELQFLISIFQASEEDISILQSSFRIGKHHDQDHDGYISDADFQRQLTFVRGSIAEGLHPKMIQTGSSGSYFVRCFHYEPSELANTHCSSVTRNETESSIVAVFKPHDEEPYGDFNPKRVFLRRYLWWAMGRPCLIPSFSYLSEVGASLLDDRLKLGMVPSTRLVFLASKQFSYPQSVHTKGHYPEKPGSYQQFLSGYINASAFLRAHPWPSRPRSLLEQDLRAENTAHGRAKARARKGKGETNKKSVGRRCISLLTPINCLAPIGLTSAEDGRISDRDCQPTGAESEDEQILGFEWTSELMEDFRLELERLVCFDYLIRNTDRGLDNFMIKIVDPPSECTDASMSPSAPIRRRRLVLAAIDNSLAFPWKHPAGIRSYPWGWLYLPTDLIGGPFSAQTRAAFLPFLRSASWWQQLRNDLEALFRKDDNFNTKKFEGQMQVLRGQGSNLLESLRNEDEGPLELCARQKRLVTQRSELAEVASFCTRDDDLLPLTPEAVSIKANVIDVARQKTKAVAEATVVAPASTSIAIPTASPNASSATSPHTNKKSTNDANVTPRSLPERSSGHDGDAESDQQQWGIHSVIDGINHRPAESPASPNKVHQNGVDNASKTDPLKAAPPSSPSQTPGDVALGRAYRRGTLGIDVLTEIDKSTSKARRPGLRKTLTRAPSVTRIPSRRTHSFIAARDSNKNAAMPSGDSNILHSGNDDAGEHGMLASVASLDNLGPLPSSSSTAHGRFAASSRRRMGSVSDAWNDAAAFHRITQANADETAPERVRVLMEEIQIDNGVAWQTWLGLQ